MTILDKVANFLRTQNRPCCLMEIVGGIGEKYSSVQVSLSKAYTTGNLRSYLIIRSGGRYSYVGEGAAAEPSTVMPIRPPPDIVDIDPGHHTATVIPLPTSYNTKINQTSDLDDLKRRIEAAAMLFHRGLSELSNIHKEIELRKVC